MNQEYSPIEAYWAIREACLKRPTLRMKEWQGKEDDPMPDNPYMGFCYIATEVFCYLIPESRRKKMHTVNHHFATIDGKVWDLTAEQFNYTLNYKKSYQLNRKPLTERARLLLEAIE